MLSMVAFLYYPLFLIEFWYRDVLFGLINFFVRFNRYVISLLSLGLLTRTFFKPLKNEYRQGLVLFSIFFGMAIKTVLISVLLSVVLIFIFIECLIVLLIAFIPIALLFIVLGSDSKVWYE